MTVEADIPSSIKLAATDCCPYTCDSKQEPGIVVEYLQEILAHYDIALDIRYLPWKLPWAIAYVYIHIDLAAGSISIRPL